MGRVRPFMWNNASRYYSLKSMNISNKSHEDSRIEDSYSVSTDLFIFGTFLIFLIICNFLSWMVGCYKNCIPVSQLNMVFLVNYYIVQMHTIHLSILVSSFKL